MPPSAKIADKSVQWLVRPSARSAEEVLARIQGMRGIRPPQLTLFQMRELAPVPGVTQAHIERWQTPRAMTPRQASFSNRQKTLLRDVERGVQQGAHAWYHNEPVRQQFIYELGNEAGDKDFRRWADMVAGSSSSADVLSNIRKASLYRQRALQGLLPDDIDTSAHAAEWLEQNPLPQGYGSVARRNDAMWTSRFLAGDQLHRALEPGAAHKILSFRENLRGNLLPWTGDRHEAARLGIPEVLNRKTGAMEKGQLTANDYVAAEAMMRRLSDRAGLSPAEFQSARWIGGAHATGVESTDPSFSHAMEQAVRTQAKRMGETPEWVLRDFIRNGGLLAVPAVAPSTEDDF